MGVLDEVNRLKKQVYYLERKLSQPVVTAPPSGNGFQGQATAVWSGTGLIFNVYWPIYFIDGVQYASGSGTVTLTTADPTNPRLDVIAISSLTGPIALTGTPAVNPVKPTVDSTTQLEITTVLVDAGATTPSEITDIDVYLENSEWTPSSDIPGIDFADTTDPFAGLLDISVGLFTAGQYIRFTDLDINVADVTFLKFYIKLKANFTRQTGLIFTFLNGTTPISTSVTIVNNVYGFAQNNTSDYQLVVIPISDFSFVNATFNAINIQMKGTNSAGFYLDNIILQGGIIGSTSLQNAITTIQTDSGAVVSDQPNDVIQILGGTNVTTSATGKTITINATGGGTTSDVLIDCGSFTAPNENLLIDCGSF